MIIRTPRAEIDAYYAFEAVNQSALKKIMINGIQAFNAERLAIMTGKEDLYEEKEWLIIGQGADTMQTEGAEQFYKDYHVSQLEKKPSDTLKRILQMTLTTLQVLGIPARDLDQHQELVHNSINTVPGKDDKGNPTVGYFMNRAKDKKGNDIPWQDDTRLLGILQDQTCLDYWNDLKSATGKQILTLEEKGTIDTIVNNWNTHDNTKAVFENRSSVITVYQYPMYFTYEGVLCKALVDKLDIDLLARTITPQDLKTMSGFVGKFPGSLLYRRYDFQAAFYTQGLYQSLVELSAAIGIDVTGFTINKFEFIVESTTNPGAPAIFQLNGPLLRIGAVGNEEYKGFTQMINEYKYWQRFDFDFAKATSTVGKLVINDQFKIDNLI